MRFNRLKCGVRIERFRREDDCGAVGDGGQSCHDASKAVIEGHRHTDPIGLGVFEDLADKEAESSNMNPVDLGKSLYEKKGCNACHTVDGTPRVGPSFFHDFGTTVPLSDGSKVQMDENYIRESILSPQSKSRPGYPPSMPSFEGQLKENEIQGLIEYI